MHRSIVLLEVHIVIVTQKQTRVCWFLCVTISGSIRVYSVKDIGDGRHPSKGSGWMSSTTTCRLRLGREAGDTSTIRISTRGILEWMVFISRSQARLHFLGIWPDTSTGIDGPMCKRSGQPNSQLMLRQLLGGTSHQECSRISTKISAEPG